MAGWDAGLARRCIASPDPLGVNGYSDMTDADGTGRHYVVAVQSETVYGQSIGGNPNQSLPINAGGALSLDWQAHPGGYTVNMLSDFYHHAAPGQDAYNWYTMQEDISHGGGPFGGGNVRTALTLACDWWCPAGEARFFVSCGYWYDDAPHIVEVNVALSPGWSTQFPHTDDLIGWLPFNGGDFVSVDGRGWGLSVPKATTAPLTMDWGRVLQTLCQRYDQGRGRHLFAPPVAPPIVAVIGVGMETLTRTTTNAAIAQLWVSGITHEAV